MLEFCRPCSITNAVDDVELQQKLSYLLEFRGKLDEEKWRAGVDIELIFAYFKVLLEYLVSQVTTSVTLIADLKHELQSTQEDLQVTKTSLAESRSEVYSLSTENIVLSTILDQLDEENQSKFSNCRDSLKDVSEAEFHELHERTDVLRVSHPGNLGSCL